ncbi:hypothetical protein [Helicobacter labacensis]|uniref:hypothetical protein n=1 Tax=Helicobacter labacensis TaxID=2316079 RepID=UPI0013CE1825|nr:hypothetical protein [Helicobacter labacensis]
MPRLLLGRYYGEVYVEGKRKRFSFRMLDTPQNRAKAQELHEGKDCPKSPEGGRALGDLVQAYQKRLEWLKPTSKRSIASFLRRVVELLGGAHTPLSHINKDLVHNFYSQLVASNTSQAHINNLAHQLKALLAFGVEEDFLQLCSFAMLGFVALLS